MPNSIPYQLHKGAKGVEVSIVASWTDEDRKGIVIAASSAAIGSLILLLFGFGFLPVFFALLAFLIAGLFAWGICERIATRKLLFLPDRLVLTSSIFGIRKTKVIPFRSIDHFGYGNFGHEGIPVLKFEVSNRWTVLAHNVAEADADDLMELLAAQGITFPQPRQTGLS